MRQELLSINLAVEVLSELSTSYDAHLQEHDRAAQFGGYVPLDDELPVEVPLRLLRLAQSSISKEPVSAITFKDEVVDFISRKSRFEIDECLVTVCGSNAPTVARNIAQAYLVQPPPPVERDAP